jgi:hypothetical protein
VNGNLPRNSGALPPGITVNAGFSRRFSLGRRALEGHRSTVISINVTNLTNHLNVQAVSGVVGSSLFGAPVAADPSRRIEVALRYNF